MLNFTITIIRHAFPVHFLVLHFFPILKYSAIHFFPSTLFYIVLNFHVDSIARVQGSEDRDVVQEAKDIVDGHRDATLLLLWKILYGCELRHVRSVRGIANLLSLQSI